MTQQPQVISKGEDVAGKPHISYSQVSTFGDCRRRWYWGRIYPDRIKQDLNRILGSAYHQAVAYDARHQMEHGKPAPIPSLVKVGLDYWNDSLAAGNYLQKPKEKPDELAATLAKMLTIYGKEVAPTLPKPVAVEQKLTVDLPGTDYQLMAIIDMVTEDGIIIEHKTAGRAPTNMHPLKDDKSSVLFIPSDNERFQLTCYTLVCQMLNLPAVGAEIWTMSKAKTPKHFKIPYQVTEAEMQLMLNQFAWMIDQLNQPDAIAPNFSAFWCSPTGCSHFDQCHEESGRRTIDDLVNVALIAKGGESDGS